MNNDLVWSGKSEIVRQLATSLYVLEMHAFIRSAEAVEAFFNLKSLGKI